MTKGPDYSPIYLFPCDLPNQGSSSSSLVVFRFSGSHCNIDLTKLRNSSLSFPLRFSPTASRLLDGKRGNRSGNLSSGSSHVPFSSNHSGGPLAPFYQIRWRWPEKRDHFCQMCASGITSFFGIFPREEMRSLKDIPYLLPRQHNEIHDPS